MAVRGCDYAIRGGLAASGDDQTATRRLADSGRVPGLAVSEPERELLDQLRRRLCAGGRSEGGANVPACIESSVCRGGHEGDLHREGLYPKLAGRGAAARRRGRT